MEVYDKTLTIEVLPDINNSIIKEDLLTFFPTSGCALNDGEINFNQSKIVIIYCLVIVIYT